MIEVPPCFFRVSIKALVLNKENKFLLLEEPNGLWDLPGGGLEHHENYADCLKREIWEEMRILPKRIDEHPIHFFTFLNFKKIYLANVIYKVELESLNFTETDECINLDFFSKDQILFNPSLFYPNVLKFAEML